VKSLEVINMNKIMKTLISVLLIVGLVLPATVIGGFDSINVNDIGITDDDDTVTFKFNADSDTKIDNVIVTARAALVTTPVTYTNLATVIVDIPATYGKSVDATFTTESLGINGVGTYTLNIWADVNGNSAVDTDESADITVIVSEANPAAPIQLLANNLVSEIDLEEDELTFNDEVVFEIDFEHSDAANDVEEAYFEIALYDGEDKLAGWIESKDDNIRFEDDEEVTFDQDDLNAKLFIPTQDDIDMDGEDTKELQLVVRVFGDYEYNGIDYNQHLLDVDEQTITVEKLDDHLTIESVSIEQQGNVLYTAITVENDGEENQKDVRARVQIAGTDVKQTSNTITVYEDDDATIYVPVVLPAFATGEYNVKVTVYNNDVSATETIEDVELAGIMSPNTQPEGGVVIGVDTAVKTIPANGAVYAMTFTNNDAVARTFVLETAGAEWAQTSVNPTTVVVGAGSSEIASIFVAPNANELGTRQFTVFIKEGTQIVKTIGLTANVEGNSVTGNAGFDFEDVVDSGLKWIAAILVVVLIVLFVMWSWNKAEEEL
jgi:hypothetical protein